MIEASLSQMWEEVYEYPSQKSFFYPNTDDSEQPQTPSNSLTPHNSLRREW